MNFLRNTLVLCSLLYFLSQSSFSQPGWVTQSSGTSENLHSVFFVSDLTGWVVGTSGKVLKTTNGGTNWISQSSETLGDLLSVYFVNSLSGWAVGASGDIIATGNGGTNWSLQKTGSTSALNSVCFITASTGWAVGEFMTILKTTNGGTNWFSLLGGSVSLKSVVFTSLSVGYIAGSGGTIMKTTNGGINWTITNSNVLYDLYYIHFPAGSTTTGYTIGMGSPSPPILKSTDSGLSWIIQPVPLGNALTSVFFTNVSTGWAAGWIGTIMYTSNGGANWSDQISGTSNSLRGIYFTSAATGWAVGDAGTILKTTNGGITALEPISNNIPVHFSLEQNYPNPFNPTTNFEFRIAEFGFVNLTIYDAAGREVETLVNEQLNAGTYKAGWNAAGYSSGIYFYKLTAGDFTETKKMLMIK